MGLNTVAIHLPPDTYRRVVRRARQMGKVPDEWTREVIEAALRTHKLPGPQTTTEVLQAAGRVRPLSEALRRRIIPGVTLDEVRSSLSEATGPSLSEIIVEQRGPTL